MCQSTGTVIRIVIRRRKSEYRRIVSSIFVHSTNVELIQFSGLRDIWRAKTDRGSALREFTHVEGGNMMLLFDQT